MAKCEYCNEVAVAGRETCRDCELVSLADAARECGFTRQAMDTYVQTGRLSVTHEQQFVRRVTRRELRRFKEWLESRKVEQ